MAVCIMGIIDRQGSTSAVEESVANLYPFPPQSGEREVGETHHPIPHHRCHSGQSFHWELQQDELLRQNTQATGHKCKRKELMPAATKFQHL